MAVDADLMQAIVADPEDIGPRLVYADWLMEQGDPRGEFIVAQCRGEDASLGDEERAEWSRRADALFAKHGRKWKEPFRRAGIRRLEFRRGFVSDLTLNAGRSIDFIEEILAECPLDRLKVRRLKGDVEKLARCPTLVSLRELNLAAADVSGKRAATLLGSPHIGNLEVLIASGSKFGRLGTTAITKVKWTRLHTLSLANNRLDPHAIEILANGLPETIRELDLCGNAHTDASIAALARSPRLHALRSLDVSASWSVAGGWSEAGDPNTVSESAARSLVDAHFASTLEVLRARGWRMGAEGQRILHDRFGCIRELETRDGEDEF